jgi:hypothetical protein
MGGLWRGEWEWDVVESLGVVGMQRAASKGGCSQEWPPYKIGCSGWDRQSVVSRFTLTGVVLLY